MKEVKFRAWDKEECKMFNNVNPIFNEKGDLDFLILKYTFGGYNLGEIDLKVYYSVMFSDDLKIPVEIMQYTGLKDKNGVEIYEGDVVKIHIDNDFDYVDGFGVVKFRQGGFVIDHSNLGTELEWLYYPQDDCEVEIIGNIYENKELVK